MPLPLPVELEPPPLGLCVTRKNGARLLTASSAFWGVMDPSNCERGRQGKTGTERGGELSISPVEKLPSCSDLRVCTRVTKLVGYLLDT